MTGGKTIIFHDLGHARAALAAAHEHNLAITLQTAPGAAAYAGVGYLKAVNDKAGAHEAIIDCGEDPGVVLAALRAGWKRLIFSGERDVFDKLAQMAGQQGATITEAGPKGPILDLLDAPDPAIACLDFLRPDQ